MKPPAPITVADWLVVESTYGNRKHDNTDPVETIANASIAIGHTNWFRMGLFIKNGAALRRWQ